MPTTEVRVAAGVIEGPDGRVLLTRRLLSAHQGGKWEFPGGKLEPGESASHALTRELQEEISITPTQIQELIEVAHDYGDKQVRLYVFVVQAFTGQPSAQEGQGMQWFEPGELSDLDFPAANVPILQAYLSS